MSASTSSRIQAAPQAGVVGNGTPASCTDAALGAALANAGAVSFDCGASPHIIIVSIQRTIGADTALDGGGLITLQAQGSRHFLVNPGTKFTLENITLTSGYFAGDGGSVRNNGTLVVNNAQFISNTTSIDFSGGAIVSYGPLTITNSLFENNRGGSGGAVYPRWTAATTRIVNSVFRNNRTYNTSNGYGGALLVWDDASATIVNSTFEHNQAELGGAIYNFFNSSLRLETTVLISNTALQRGGAIYNEAELTMTTTSLIDNEAAIFGGGLYNAGGVVVASNSQINGNRLTNANSEAHGGGIYNTFYALAGGQSVSGTVELIASELSGNRAKRGAGINNNGALTLTASLVANNLASDFGGGIYIDNGAVSISNSTLSDNSATFHAGALYKSEGTLAVQFSTFSGNTANDGSTIYFNLNEGNNSSFDSVIVDGNCMGDAATSQGYNLETGASCGFTQTGDRQNTDPRLGALSDNRGPTRTQLPVLGSPAIDAGGANCPSFDQRGEPRPRGAACDVGAVEVDASPTCGGAFMPMADTTISSGSVDMQQGGLSYLTISNNGGTENAVLLGFDLTNKLDDFAAVQSAHLELPVQLDRAPTITDAVTVYDLTSDWDESSTWTNQPTRGVSFGTEAMFVTGNSVRVDVTALVMHWANGEVTRTSVLLAASNANGMNLQLFSREGAPQPRLVIECKPVPLAASSTPSGADAQQNAGLVRLRQASTEVPTVRMKDGLFEFGRFMVSVPATATTGLQQAEWFLQSYRDLLQLHDPSDTFQFVSESEDGKSFRFRQVHGGVPVFPSGVLVRVDGGVGSAGHVTGFNGSYLPQVGLDATPTISATLASQLAQTLYPERSMVGDTQLRYVNLGLEGGDPITRLAWEVHLGYSSREYSVLIDAHSGERITERPANLSIQLDLRTGNNNAIGPCGSFTTTTRWFDQAGVISPPPIPAPSAEGTNAFNIIRNVHSWWLNATGIRRNGYDGKDSLMYLMVHWNAQNATGGGNCMQIGNGYVANDVLAHEFTHMVTGSSAGLQYLNESGALNESVSDIFAYSFSGQRLIGINAPGLSGPPLVGVTGCVVGTNAVRDLANPPCFGQPDRKTNYQNIPAANDSGGVHTNSGIHNKAFWLMTVGGTFNGYTVVGIGSFKTSQLFYRVLNNCLTTTSNFLNSSLCAIVSEGRDLVSEGVLNANDLCQIKNAFAATEINTIYGDRDCDGTADVVDADEDGDGTPNSKDNCPKVVNNQSNIDGDALGDACDDDMDGDTRLNAQDNCPRVENWGEYRIYRKLKSGVFSFYSFTIINDFQNDWNNNSVGDACDDSEPFGQKDKVVDRYDNCRSAYNPDQSNIDDDEFGDACDTDDDNDGVADTTDNCRLIRNPGQENKDSDLYGDVCDKCPGYNSVDNGDVDGDGFGNVCDIDADNDNICSFGTNITNQPGLNPATKICFAGKGKVQSPFPGILWPADNCWLVPNEDQWDGDSNGLGYKCDSAERVAFGRRLSDINVKYALSRYTVGKLPIPICPQCSLNGLLVRGYQSKINLVLPANVNARVVDGAGNVVARPVKVGSIFQLSFFPPAYAGKTLRLGALNTAQRGRAADDTEPFHPLDDDTVYYLELSQAPGAGTDEPQDVTVTGSVVESVVTGKSTVYLPLAHK